ncbi:TPA: LexA family transcriptional regulator [Enterococcus faecalis]|nr:LexA family transcriptional regulator [Enterococcus faecalis]
MESEKLSKYIGQKIKLYRSKKNLTQEELARKVGTKKATISNYETGYRSPQQDMLFELANVLDISINDLFPPSSNSKNNHSSIETIYEKLDPPRKKKVYKCAEEELKKQLEEEKQSNVTEIDFTDKKKLPTVDSSAVAANPTELAYGDTVIEEKEFERVPACADFAVPISGDSMQPEIENGQLVFIRKQPDFNDGDIVVIEIDGDGVTCKKVYRDYENKMIILHSINEKYPDRKVEPERIRIIGKVVN